MKRLYLKMALVCWLMAMVCMVGLAHGMTPQERQKAMMEELYGWVLSHAKEAEAIGWDIGEKLANCQVPRTYEGFIDYFEYRYQGLVEDYILFAQKTYYKYYGKRLTGQQVKLIRKQCYISFRKGLEQGMESTGMTLREVFDMFNDQCPNG